jgi:hypothetical protein
MEEHEELERPFDFRQCVSIIRSTGEKAGDLRELREIIAKVSDDSIFHHTYQYFLKEHILEYTNDFAQWAGESLEERALAEQLSNIDPYSFGSIADLRAALVGVIDSYLEGSRNRATPFRGTNSFSTRRSLSSFLSGSTRRTWRNSFLP